MEKFIKENWFKISIVVILLAIVLSAIYYFFSFIPSQQNNKIQTSDITQQVKCSEQSAIFYKNESKTLAGFDASIVTYTSHYSLKFKGCFMLINGNYNDYGSSSIWKSFYNANTQKVYAKYNNVTGGKLNGIPALCIVKGAYCSSEAEFDTFVNDYMNN